MVARRLGRRTGELEEERVSVWEDGQGLEMDGSNDRTTHEHTQCHRTNGKLQIVKMANFIVYILPQFKKKNKQATRRLLTKGTAQESTHWKD